MNNLKKHITWGITAVIALVLVVLAFKSYVVVQGGHRGVLSKWGAIQPVAFAPGFHLINPFGDSVRMISVQVQNASATQSAASKDLQVVTTKVAVNFNLTPSTISETYQNIGGLQSVFDKVISPAISNAVKAVTAHFNADELVAKRDIVKAEITEQIKKAMIPYGVTIDTVNITNFAFSQQYDNAIEAKQVSQQRAQQATYQLERAKTDSQKQVVEARAAAQAAIAAAQGQAKSTIIVAKADAAAMRLRRTAITPEILELDWINKWSGNVPHVSLGQSGRTLINIPSFGK